MKIVLSGLPGSGKGTQAEILSTQLDFAHFSTGKVFRDHITRKTEIGLEAQKYMNQGELVPDIIVLKLTQDFLMHNQKSGIIFDGFPRTIGQAQGLDTTLQKWNDKINLVIFIELPASEIIKRLTARRTCLSCNTIYNIDFKPSRSPGVCDVCGGKIYQRSDDTEPIIKQRLTVYENQTKDLKGYYKKNYNVYEIDGMLGKDAVLKEILSLIKTNK
jgi:adenylate kinase